MYRTMLDLIKPKLVFLDLPLFMALLSDLFPGVDMPPAPVGSLRKAIEAELQENNLQASSSWTALNDVACLAVKRWPDRENVQYVPAVLKSPCCKLPFPAGKQQHTNEGQLLCYAGCPRICHQDNPDLRLQGRPARQHDCGQDRRRQERCLADAPEGSCQAQEGGARK